MGNFDPYLAWLDIPNDQRPASHYRLLGIRQCENDSQVIAAAADRVLNHLAQFQHSAQAAECSRLMQEVQAARACLLDSSQKARYDEALQQGQHTGTAGNLRAAGQDGAMFPPASAGQEQQIGQAPPVPGTAPPSTGGGPERQIASAPPVPGGGPIGMGQERKLAPPPTGPVLSAGGETQLRPPPGVPTSAPGGAGTSPGLPPGQQISGPGLPKPSTPSLPGPAMPGPASTSGEQPLSGPAALGPGGVGSVPGSPLSRPMPRGPAQLAPGPGTGAPTVPMGPGGPPAGGQPGGGPYMPTGPAGMPQSGTPMGASPEQPIQPGSIPMPQMGPGLYAPGQIPGQTQGPSGPMPQHPYGQMPMQPGQGYPPTPMPGGPAAGLPVQSPQPQGGSPSWAPEHRTGQVGQSVANAVAGQKSPGDTTSYANREGRKGKARRKSSTTYQALVIVLAGAIVLIGFILALIIAHFML